jgi:plasmid stabilization system protein ParE
MTYSLHREAETDLLDAARFYRREGGAKLANRFLDEFERVAKLLIEFPGIGTPAEDLRRVHPLQDFPYSVIYRENGGHIRVLVVRGHFRDPEHGESRR